MKTILPYKAFSALIILLTFNVSFGQTPEERQEMANKIDAKEAALLTKEFEKYQKKQKEAINSALKQGYKRTILNEDGTEDILAGVTPSGTPYYNTLNNENAAIASGARALNTGGSLGLNVNGENMSIYIWELGRVRTTHTEFAVANKVVQVDDGSAYGSPGDLNGNSSHANHISGTAAARGAAPAAKGMAPLANIKAYVVDDATNEINELNALAGGSLVSNHSQGTAIAAIDDWIFGSYTPSCFWFDGITNAKKFLLPVISAGNDGNNSTDNASPLEGNSGYDKLSFKKVSKNPLVVANGVRNMSVASGFTIHPTSSQGPTDDLRIKPDITGIGTSVYSCTAASDTSYQTATGTSIASPVVAGNILLLQQHYNNVNGTYMQAATAKGLVLHTATDDVANSGPDAISGWGLINTKKAAEVITNSGSGSIIEEQQMTDSSSSYTISVTTDGSEPLIASISWSDTQASGYSGPNANVGTKVLINDLDLRITRDLSTFYPWRLTSVSTNANNGDNDVDPFERVDVMNPIAGTYNITVSKKGTITGTEDYAVIITGGNLINLSTKEFTPDVVKTYPNPTTDLLNVKFNNANKNVALTITDIQGRKVLNKEYRTTNKVFSQQLDLSTLNGGIYMLSINNGGAVVNKKIIKK